MNLERENGIDLEVNFDKIYLLYYPKMFRFAKEYLIHEEEAENIVQDVFMYLWERRQEISIHINWQSYIFTLVKNRCLDYLRHRKVEEEYYEELMYKKSAIEQLNTEFTSLEELEKAIQSAINKLPDRCRKIFLMSRIEGKRYREIATELNLSENTIESQMAIALKKLRIELQEYIPLIIFLIFVK